VLTKFTDVKLDSDDVYVNISRGLNVSEPGIDLAAIAAIISSKK
jgi:predicted ATP-dependent serine protease